jgi:NTE family protein
VAARRGVKRVNLALQGGGSHGAFAWGVLDSFLADGRLEIEGISGTSAGSVNAVVYAHGRVTGGVEGARAALATFWKRLSAAGAGAGQAHAFHAFMRMAGAGSPYQWNPFNWNPFRQALEETVDFERLRASRITKLFLAATNVETGKARIFTTAEVSVDVVMASSCLPFLFQAVEIDGQHYWDGGFLGNPVLYPLIYETVSRDLIILHINPIERPGVPRLPHEIENRLNEITFNSSLIKELRAIAFVQKLLADGWVRREFRPRLKDVLMHSVRADEALRDLPSAGEASLDWAYLEDLHRRGWASGSAWLARNFRHLGRRSSVDLRKEFL